jgi:signal transduction histidine kinase/ligand-binding sensor domain-containing protein/CheY-like chemotaxis protein/HPt (histidine-containing phosphotransfer) domain-containing protein
MQLGRKLKAWHRLGVGMLLLVLAQTASAVPPMVLQHLTTDDGLPQNTVMATLRDTQGFMWFATEDGLVRYDGYEFQRYARDRGDDASLASSFVWDVKQDRRGDLWVALRDGGIARLDQQSGRWSSFRHDPANPRSLASDATRKLLVDRLGRIWVGTVGGGVSVLNAVSGDFESYRRIPDRDDSLSSDVVTALYEDANGEIWVGTDDGLNRWLPQSRTFRRYQRSGDAVRKLSSNRISALGGDRDGSLWIGTVDAGLSRLDSAGQFTTYRHDPRRPDSLIADDVRAVLEDNEGRLWVATMAGLDMLDRARDGFAHNRADPSIGSSLRDNFVMSLYQDATGLLWIGTRAGGVSRWNPRSWAFGHVAPAWLGSNNILAFASDSAERVWIAARGTGLVRFDPRSGEQVALEQLIRNGARLPDKDVMSLLMDRAGNLWIGTRTAGLSRLGKDGQLTSLRTDAKDPNSISNDGIMALHEDRSGGLWIGTFGGGVNILDPATGRVQRIPYDSRLANSLSSPRATAIAEDANGNFWIGTDSGGLDLLSRDGTVLRVFRHDPRAANSISANTIYALHVDARGRVWIGTDTGGLDLVVGSSATPDAIGFRNYSKLDGLSNDTIYGIHSDDTGALWMSSNAGLMRLDPETGKVTLFHRDQGLQDEEFNFGAHGRTSDGRMLFGGPKGFNYFDPKKLERAAAPPDVVVTKVAALNRPLQTAMPFPLLRTLTLGYRDEFLTIEFAALDFSNARGSRYSYRLRGLQDNWIDLGTQRRIDYPRLDSGSYVLEVRAAARDGAWSTRPMTLALTVQPAPWRTLWAYLLYALLAVAVALSPLYAQRRKLRQAAATQQRLEREVLDRTRDLRQQNEELNRLSRAKSDFVARMSHEIRTPMNGVLGMSELLTRSNLSARQAQFANAINSSARALLHIINEVLDLSKMEASKIVLEQAPFDLRQLIEDSAAVLEIQAESKGLELVVSPPAEDNCVLIGDAMRLRQVLVNLIGNAIKFTPAGEVVVTATLDRSGGADVGVEIAVSDTGIGMSPEVIARVFEPFTQADETTTRKFGGTGLGLAICKQITDLMGGHIRVESESGAGSSFIVSLRLPAACPIEQQPAHEALRGWRAAVCGRNASFNAALLRQCRAWGMIIDEINSVKNLRRFARSSDAPDIDVLLVDANNLGQELGMLEARRPNERAPALLLLSSSMTAISERLEERFRDATLIGKPCRSEALYRALLQALHIGEQAGRAGGPDGDAASSHDSGRLQGHVLIVDDNPVNCMVCEGMLAELGCTSVTTNGGREALILADTQRFDAILLDLSMPDMDGFETCRLLRQRENAQRRTPIVAVSAHAAESHRSLCLDAGMDDYLCKPFTQAEVLAILRRWLPAATGAAAPGRDAGSQRDDTLLSRELDAAALARIRALDRPGRPSMLKRVVEVFVGTAEQQVADLHTALVAADLGTVRRIAHSLKASFGNVGALHLARVTAELEQACVRADIGAARSLASTIQTGYPSVVDALQQQVRSDCA